MTAAPVQSTSYTDLRAWLQGTPKIAGTLPEKDDDGKPATEGERSSENSADIKKWIAPGQNIDAGTKNPADGDTNKPVPDSGLMQTTVGHMPEVERAVKTVTEENEKVSGLDLSKDADFAAGIASLEKMASAMSILLSAQPAPAAAPAVNGTKAAAATPPTDKSKPQADSQVKDAAEAQRAALVADYVKFAGDRATLVGSYLRGYFDQYDALQKLAADGGMDAMMAGGGGGGAPPEAAAPAPDAAPAAAPGGPPAGPEGAGAPGGDGTPSVEELAAALAEMGVTPDELMQVAQQMQGGVEGNASAPPADKAAAVAQLTSTIKLASDAKDLMRSNKFRYKPAADGSDARKRMDAARDYVTELFRIANR